MKRLIFSVFTVLLLTVGTAQAGLFEDGLAASKRGDYSEAVMLYRLAAAQGNADAQFSLGYMYYHGFGVASDHAEAMKWFRLAAAQGNSMAKYYLGNMYIDNEKSIKGKPNVSNQNEGSLPDESITLPNGGMYVGELKDGKPHGQGTHTVVVK
jgi:TPR repeat protein